MLPTILTFVYGTAPSGLISLSKELLRIVTFVPLRAGVIGQPDGEEAAATALHEVVLDQDVRRRGRRAAGQLLQEDVEHLAVAEAAVADRQAVGGPDLKALHVRTGARAQREVVDVHAVDQDVGRRRRRRRPVRRDAVVVIHGRARAAADERDVARRLRPAREHLEVLVGVRAQRDVLRGLVDPQRALEPHPAQLQMTSRDVQRGREAGRGARRGHEDDVLGGGLRGVHRQAWCPNRCRRRPRRSGRGPPRDTRG